MARSSWWTSRSRQTGRLALGSDTEHWRQEHMSQSTRQRTTRERADAGGRVGVVSSDAGRGSKVCLKIDSRRKCRRLFYMEAGA